ncbi:hypothetical protein VMA_000958 [Vibrio mimicus VM223]|nr:hypothetical protein VMA_000958 [Vibrio mimicus VM223]
MTLKLELGQQAHRMHIFRDKGVVHYAKAKLHRHIQTGGRFSAARYAKQNDVRPVEVFERNAIIMRQGVFNGCDPIKIGVRILPDTARALQLGRGFHLNIIAHPLHYALQHIVKMRGRLQQTSPHFGDHHREKHQGLHTMLLVRTLDLLEQFTQFFVTFHKRKGFFIGLHSKLTQYDVPQRFTSDGCSVRNIEHITALRFHLHLLFKLSKIFD